MNRVEATRQVVGSVEILGDGVPYLDGAEDELLALMRNAPDRSASALAHAIKDWPTNYHLSPLRSQLLMPVELSEGLTVLDVGCGTGALTREFAESGADVIGLEGSLQRARVAAERVRGMSNARIMCGSVEDYTRNRPPAAPPEFDLIMLCGVLEYSGSGLGGDDGPQVMLNQLRSLLKPTGSLVVAIENRWGLKYLLSHPEDHLGRPWIGLEGYWRNAGGIRTWSRRELATMLEERGFPNQSWFAAFPDYKLPRLLISEELFGSETGTELVKQFVRDPVSDVPDPSTLAADPLLTFHSALDAGLGLELANSFLVVCGAADSTLRTETGLVFLGDGQRASAWRSKRVVRSIATETPVLEVKGDPAPVENWPLVHHRVTCDVIPGVNAEDLLRAAVIAEGLHGVALEALLRTWYQEVQTVVASTEGPMLFDLMPGNFIVDHAGKWHLVDTEFRWAEALTTAFVAWRSLMWTSIRLVKGVGVIHGVASDTSIADVVRSVLSRLGIRIDLKEWESYETLESRIQARVAGDTSESAESAHVLSLRGYLASTVGAFAPRPPYLSVLASNEVLQNTASELGSRLDAATARGALLTEDLTAAADRAQELETQKNALEEDKSRLEAQRAALEAERADLEMLVAQMSNSRRWRTAERLKRPFG